MAFYYKNRKSTDGRILRKARRRALRKDINPFFFTLFAPPQGVLEQSFCNPGAT
jgi:hypothetical protein